MDDYRTANFVVESKAEVKVKVHCRATFFWHDHFPADPVAVFPYKMEQPVEVNYRSKFIKVMDMDLKLLTLHSPLDVSPSGRFVFYVNTTYPDVDTIISMDLLYRRKREHHIHSKRFIYQVRCIIVTSDTSAIVLATSPRPKKKTDRHDVYSVKFNKDCAFFGPSLQRIDDECLEETFLFKLNQNAWAIFTYFPASESNSQRSKLSIYDVLENEIFAEVQIDLEGCPGSTILCAAALKDKELHLQYTCHSFIINLQESGSPVAIPTRHLTNNAYNGNYLFTGCGPSCLAVPWGENFNKKDSFNEAPLIELWNFNWEVGKFIFHKTFIHPSGPETRVFFGQHDHSCLIFIYNEDYCESGSKNYVRLYNVLFPNSDISSECLEYSTMLQLSGNNTERSAESIYRPIYFLRTPEDNIERPKQKKQQLDLRFLRY